MGILKTSQKNLKQAAPVIGSAIGMYVGGPIGGCYRFWYWVFRRR